MWEDGAPSGRQSGRKSHVLLADDHRTGRTVQSVGVYCPRGFSGVPEEFQHHLVGSGRGLRRHLPSRHHCSVSYRVPGTRTRRLRLLQVGDALRPVDELCSRRFQINDRNVDVRNLFW